MNRELYILRELLDNSRISQRQLAKKAELSLGTINAIMQKLERDEFINSKVISGKSTEYTITKEGFMRKALLSQEHAIKSYQFIGEIRSIMKYNLELLV